MLGLRDLGSLVFKVLGGRDLVRVSFQDCRFGGGQSHPKARS